MPDIKALLHLQPRDDIAQVFVAHIHRHHIGDLRRQGQPVGVHIGDHHVARAHMPRHGRGHDPDRPRAGDQHILAHQIE